MGLFGKRRVGVVLHAENSKCSKGRSGAGGDDSVDISVDDDANPDDSFWSLIRPITGAPPAGTRQIRVLYLGISLEFLSQRWIVIYKIARGYDCMHKRSKEARRYGTYIAVQKNMTTRCTRLSPLSRGCGLRPRPGFCQQFANFKSINS